MEEFNWNYVWAALAINFLIVWIVPRVIKKPSGVQVIDDTVLYLNSTKSFLLSSSIVIAIVMYGAHYWVDSQSGGGHDGPKSPSPDF
jgi:hypothetical protein